MDKRFFPLVMACGMLVAVCRCVDDNPASGNDPGAGVAGAEDLNGYPVKTDYTIEFITMP